jgi:hypothetical protein
MLPRLAAQHVVPARIDCRGAAAAAEGLQQRLCLPKLLWLGLGALVVIAHNVDIPHTSLTNEQPPNNYGLSLGFADRQYWK